MLKLIQQFRALIDALVIDGLNAIDTIEDGIHHQAADEAVAQAKGTLAYSQARLVQLRRKPMFEVACDEWQNAYIDEVIYY